MFAQSSSLEYDIDGFIEEMRREKHNNMLLAEDSMSVSESDVEEKADTKKPNAGVRRPTGAGRTPANWVPPTPGLVEVPATRLRNRQQKEKERLASATIIDPSTTPTDPPATETVYFPFIYVLIIDPQTWTTEHSSVRRRHARHHHLRRSLPISPPRHPNP